MIVSWLGLTLCPRACPRQMMKTTYFLPQVSLNDSLSIGSILRFNSGIDFSQSKYHCINPLKGSRNSVLRVQYFTLELPSASDYDKLFLLQSLPNSSPGIDSYVGAISFVDDIIRRTSEALLGWHFGEIQYFYPQFCLRQITKRCNSCVKLYQAAYWA